MYKSTEKCIWHRPSRPNVRVRRQAHDISTDRLLPGCLLGSSHLERVRCRVRLMMELEILSATKEVMTAVMTTLKSAEESEAEAMSSWRDSLWKPSTKKMTSLWPEDNIVYGYSCKCYSCPSLTVDILLDMTSAPMLHCISRTLSLHMWVTAVLGGFTMATLFHCSAPCLRALPKTTAPHHPCLPNPNCSLSILLACAKNNKLLASC